MNYRSRLIYSIWLNSLWWTRCCSLLSSLTQSLTHSKRNWDPETGWRPVNTKPTRGQCLPGQHACLSVGQHWPVGLTLRARSLWWRAQCWRKAGRCSCVSCHQQLPGRGSRKVYMDGDWGSLFLVVFFTGGMCLPASGCLTETQPGSVVSLVGPWVCVTTWCQLRGSFTRKSGCFELRTSTTGVSHTTGAYTNTQNH